MNGSAYTSSASWLSSAIEVLDNAGHDGRRLLLEAGIAETDADRETGRASIDTISRAWKVVSDTVDDPTIGVRAALQHFNPADWQSLGLAVLCSSSLRDALGRVVRYFEMLTNAADTRLEQSDHALTFVAYAREEPALIGYEAIEYGVAALLVLLREIHPAPLVPLEIRLLRPTELGNRKFAELLGCPVVFGSPYEAISFSLSIVDELLPSRNPNLAKYQDSFSENYVSRFGTNSTSARAKTEILRLLPGGEPSLQSVAARLHTSPRNLQRRLSAEKTSFKLLVADIRKELARRYLADEQRSFTEIAYLLGFSDHSSFSRAFRQWFGCSPSSHRATSPPN
jgi:AraC-like DNA-binding protein